MKTIFHKNLKAFTLCAGFFSLVACKEKTSINPDLLGDPDLIGATTVTGLQMTITNTHFDSLRTNDYDYPLVAIGGITDDPFFGRTMAGAYIQLIAPNDNYSFPAGTVIDSSILSIPYSGFSYGDTASSNPANQLKLKVYEATQTFGYDLTTPLYAFSKLTYNTNALKTVNVPISSLTDTFALNSKDTVSKLLRIRMDTLGNRFKYMTENGQAVSNGAFVQNFKGLYIAPDTTVQQNTIGYFGLFGGNSTVNYSRAQVEVYYHTPTLAFARAFFNYATTLTGFFNTIVRNYGNLPASSYYNNQTTTHDSMVISGYPGFRSDVTISLPTDSIPPSVINKATLTLTALKVGQDSRFNPPPQLIVTVVENDGTTRSLADLLNNDGTTNSTGQSFVGGAATVNGAYVQYQFNIPREIQQAVSEGKTQLKLRFAPSVTYPGAFRVVIDGPNSSNADTRMKLNIIYTKLK